MGRINRSSNTGTGKRFFSPPKRPDQLWGPPTLLFIGYLGILSRGKKTSCGVHPPSCSLDTWGSCPEVKRLGWQADQSIAYNAEVVNEWSYNATPPLHLHAMQWDNFTFSPCCWWTKYRCNGTSVIAVTGVHDMLGAGRDGYGLHWACCCGSCSYQHY